MAQGHPASSDTDYRMSVNYRDYAPIVIQGDKPVQRIHIMPRHARLIEAITNVVIGSDGREYYEAQCPMMT